MIRHGRRGDPSEITWRHDAKTIDDIKDVEKKTTDDEGTRFSVTYGVNYSGEVHNVSGLETLEDCALDRDHTQVKCSCALGRNGQVCAPKMKAMLMENELWTFKALNIQCKPDDVERTEFDVDVPMIQDDVEASQPTHRRSLGAAFDQASTKSHWLHLHTEMLQLKTIRNSRSSLKKLPTSQTCSPNSNVTCTT